MKLQSDERGEKEKISRMYPFKYLKAPFFKTNSSEIRETKLSRRCTIENIKAISSKRFSFWCL